MNWKRLSTGIVLAGTLAGGGAVTLDRQIDPYTDKGAVVEMRSMSTVDEAGENKTELAKDRPAVTLSKWNEEASLTVSYDKVKGAGSRAFLTNRMEWKDAKEEVHAYPIEAKEGMEDGGFEIEVILNEKPDTNVFTFTIEGADELDFFYQPALTDEEIANGAERPENVVGSYAVYHKTKANHRVGSTNYATGKAYHIYRPKAIDAKGTEQWAELDYKNGTLTVTVPQDFLDTATYPVTVDPTFGDTSCGASSQSIDDPARWGDEYTAPESGTVTSLHGCFNVSSTPVDTVKILINQKNGSGANSHTEVAKGQITTTVQTSAAYHLTNVSASITGSTVYVLSALASVNTGNTSIMYDSGANDYEDFTSVVYATPESPWNQALNSSFATTPSLYATYTADAPPATANTLNIKGGTVNVQGGSVIIK